MNSNLVDKTAKRGVGYRLFKSYVAFFQNRVFYKKTYWLNTENIPEEVPLMIVSNHQNCLADALAMLMSIPNRKHRKLRILSRADVFKPAFAKALRWLGILPAFRMEYDGAENVANNSVTFEEAENELLNHGTVIIYPEAGHQDKRWLGFFSYGYLRMMFETARKSNFEKELYVLPSCNHYSEYFNMRSEVLVKFGKPIALKPFYELYQTKPRTAQRQVNALVREQISELMLNITDLENYDTIDFLRETYGVGEAKRMGFDPQKLPEKLESDQRFFAKLEAAKEKEPASVQTIYDEAEKLRKAEKAYNIHDNDFDNAPSLLSLIGWGLLLLLGFPLFLAAYIPNLLIYWLPEMINRKVINDRMFYSTIKIGSMVLITVPITYTLLFVFTYLWSKNILIAALVLFVMPFLGIFAWNFWIASKRWLQKVRFISLRRQGKLSDLYVWRASVYESLNKLLKK